MYNAETHPIRKKENAMFHLLFASPNQQKSSLPTFKAVKVALFSWPNVCFSHFFVEVTYFVRFLP